MGWGGGEGEWGGMGVRVNGGLHVSVTPSSAKRVERSLLREVAGRGRRRGRGGEGEGREKGRGGRRGREGERKGQGRGEGGEGNGEGREGRGGEGEGRGRRESLHRLLMCRCWSTHPVRQTRTLTSWSRRRTDWRNTGRTAARGQCGSCSLLSSSSSS